MEERDTEKLPRLVAVAGPTASGKSELAVKLALRFGGEIVCCDSMQIYRGMDVGTAKPTAAERAAVPHHMTDVADPDTVYSAADYAEDAAACVRNIASRGRLPVVCGGTGLYLDALLFERPWSESRGATELRAALLRTAEEPGGAHRLWEELRSVDPASAESIHENNVRRVVRALEIFRSSGVPKSELDRRSGAPRFRALVLVLHRADRGEQNRRIERRVDRMLADGLLEETRSLDEAGVFASGSTAAQAIGYKELLGCLRGEKTLAEARRDLIVATRRYAKRQDTWFAAKPYATRIEIGPDSPDPWPEAEAQTLAFLGGEPPEH